MTWQRANYDEVIGSIQPGDVIAFGGTKYFSQVSKAATRSPVSHVGLILRSSPRHHDSSAGGSGAEIIEASKEGIVVRPLDEHIAEYPGNIWWLPLSAAVRNRLDLDKYTAFLLQHEGVPFDMRQAAQAVMDRLDHVPVLGEMTHSEEDFSALFCSEVAAAGLEAGGAIRSVNCSEVTPIDMFRFAIYQETYYQIKGAATTVDGFSTVDPEGWGE